MFSKRLKSTRLLRNISQADMASKLGVAKSTYSLYESGKREPDVEKIKKIAAILDVSADDLLDTNISNTNTLNESEKSLLNKYRLLDSYGINAVNTLIDIEFERSIARTNRYITNIPMFDIPASAGTGQPIDYSNYDFITVFEEPPKDAAFVLRIKGDSMTPTYYDDDRVYVSKKTDLKYGDIGIFFYNGNVYIKEYTKHGLKSHNSAYPLIGADENIKCLGKVVGKVKKWK